MIRSMTGYGQAHAELTEARVRVELRSVNHRFGDLRLRIPAGFAARESELRRRVLSKIRRGRIELQIEIEPLAGAEPAPRWNRPLARAAIEAARELRGELGEAGHGLDATALLSLPGMFRAPSEPDDCDEERFAEVGAVLDRAISALDRDRLREGGHLRDELVERVARMREHTDRIREVAATAPETVRDRLLARLGALTPEVRLDPERMAQEAALLADRCDVTEEVVRLAGHLEATAALLAVGDDEPKGKRLDFLMQEVHRETNTINSKSTDLELSRLALAMKAEIEKVREQVQNVE